MDIKIIKNPAQSKRFAFVTFDDYDPVDKAVASKFHVIKNNKIIVEKAKPKEMTLGRDDQNRQQMFKPYPNQGMRNTSAQMNYSNFQSNQQSNQQMNMSNFNANTNTSQINSNLNQIYASYNQAKSSFSNQNASYLMNQIYSNPNLNAEKMGAPGPIRNKKNFAYRQNKPYNNNRV